jgi:pyruvate formate lyase activating enzyme
MFKGIQKVTLIDFPGVIAATLFTGGCNFRCPWCHNWGLVDPEIVEKSPELTEEEIETYFRSRAGKIGGVCITGGEPTLQGKYLNPFLFRCKDLGLKVKLDTNGYEPDILKSYIERGLLDYVAMDIKNTYEKYPVTAGLNFVDTARIERSIRIIRDSGIPHHFRTTVVPGIVDPDEISSMAKMIGEPIVLQEFRDTEREMVEEAERRG